MSSHLLKQRTVSTDYGIVQQNGHSYVGAREDILYVLSKNASSVEKFNLGIIYGLDHRFWLAEQLLLRKKCGCLNR